MNYIYYIIQRENYNEMEEKKLLFMIHGWIR